MADTKSTADDVQFMRDMIVHHHQAVQMAALVKDRTNRRSSTSPSGSTLRRPTR